MSKDQVIELTKELYALTLLFPKKEPLRYKMREIGLEILLSQEFWPDMEIGLFEVLDSMLEVAKAQNWVKMEKLLRISESYSRVKTEIIEQQSADLEAQNTDLREVNADELLIPEPIEPIEPVKTSWEDPVEAPEELEATEAAVEPERQPYSEEPIEMPAAIPIETTETDLTGVTPPSVSLGTNERQKVIIDFLKENGRAQVGDLVTVLPQVTKRTLRRDFKDLLSKGVVTRTGEKNETFYQLNG